MALLLFFVLTFLSISGLAQQGVSRGNSRYRILRSGEVITRRLAGGQSHSYGLTLARGQYVHIVAEQIGIDLLLKLYGSDGVQLAKMNRWGYKDGPEPISIVADRSGEYRLSVEAANSGDAVGTYRLRIDELRSSKPNDQVVIAAEREYDKGDDLSSDGEPQSLQAGIIELRKALQLWEQADDELFQATTLLYLGVDFYNSGDPPQALEYYTKALPLWTKLKDRSGLAVALSFIAGLHNAIGNFEGSLFYSRQALPLAQELGDQRLEAQILHDLGISYYSLGQDEPALRYQREALRLAIASRNKIWEAHILHHIGEIYLSSGDRIKAQEFLNLARSRSHAAGDHLGEATALNHLGTLYDSSDDRHKALEYYSRALELRHKAGYRLGEAQTLVNLGRVYDQLGKTSSALSYYDQALQLSRLLTAPSEQAFALLGMAQAERHLEHLPQALTDIQNAIEIAESQRRQIHSEELRTSYFATLREPYDFCIDLLMQMHRQDPTKGYDAKAFETAEGSRARTLLEMLNNSHADIRRGIDHSLVEQERSMQQSINRKREIQISLLSGKHSEEQAAASTKDLEELLRKYQELEGRIRASSPGYASLMRPRAIGAKEIEQNLLDADTILLEYSLGKQRSYLWAITPESLSSFELPSQGKIEALARRMYELLARRNRELTGERKHWAQAEAEYPAVAAKLSQIVLEPVIPLLDGKRVVVVSDGALQYVPFGALPLPRTGTRAGENSTKGSEEVVPLISEHEIVNLPSASVLLEMRQETTGRKEAPKEVAVLADPVFDREDSRLHPAASKRIEDRGATRGALTPNLAQQRLLRSGADSKGTVSGLYFSRLPFTRQEADAVMGAASPEHSLEALDFSANRTTAMSSDLAQYRVVHFATHGLLDSKHPELSGLVFSLVDDKGRPQNGFLELRDIYNLNLPVDLVVLSACETALGKEIKGEGLIGLTRGFMYAGAPRVVASLWRVDDAATANFMAYFYDAMLRRGSRPAAALRQAQVEMLKHKHWSDPYYWAAFTIQGEWN